MRSPAASVAVFPTAILMALLFTGCGPQAGPTTTSSPSPTVTSTTATATATGTTTATPTATGSPSTTGTASASEAWTSYTTADGQLMFEHPAAWSVRDPAGELPEGGGAFAEVTNEAGQPLATLRTNMAVGSTCMDRYPYAVLDSQELPDLMQGEGTPRFAYETRGNDATPGRRIRPRRPTASPRSRHRPETLRRASSTSSTGRPLLPCSAPSSTRRTT